MTTIEITLNEFCAEAQRAVAFLLNDHWISDFTLTTDGVDDMIGDTFLYIEYLDGGAVRGTQFSTNNNKSVIVVDNYFKLIDIHGETFDIELLGRM